MLKNTIKLSFGRAGVLLGAALGLFTACGGTGSSGTGGGGTCTPGKTESCACPGGTQGVQTCNDDGKSLGKCDCGSTGSTGGTGGTSTGGAGGTGGQQGACGDGVEDPGECSKEFFCAADCKSGMTTSSSTGGTTTTNTCVGVVTYAGMVPNIESVWGNASGASGKSGYDAGVAICTTIGADHPCELQEVKQAEAAGELANVAQGTTAWLHRTTVAMDDKGEMSQPGPGGRCNDWTYKTHHISDGEYVTFDQPGIPTYHIDNDTVYDSAAPGVHTHPADFPCNGAMRAILCCFPSCM